MQNSTNMRILELLRFLYERTDENHPATVSDIIAHLNGKGIQAVRQTVYADTNALIDAGIDIVVVKSTQNQYFMGNRLFEYPELKMLTDAVASSKIISAKKSEELVQKLCRLTSLHQAKQLQKFAQPVELREVFKKQTGGRGKFADIIVRVEPADDDFEGSLQFVDEVKGGNIPKEYIPSIQKGFQTAMKNGVLAGYPLDRLKVTVIDGSFHPVDSDQLSFELCAIQAFKKASEKAGPVLLEPIFKVEVVTPEESMGDVIGDLNKRRGQVEGMETSRSGARIVKAKAPLAEMFGYVTALRTITSGRATSTMSFSHYAEVSSSIARNVLTECQGRVDLLK